MITRHIDVSRVQTDTQIRCERCQKYLAEQATRPWRITCSRCKHTNLSQKTILVDIAPTPPAQPQTKKKRRRQQKALDSYLNTN